MKHLSFEGHHGGRYILRRAGASGTVKGMTALAVCAALMLASCNESPDKAWALLLSHRYTFTLPETITPYTPGSTVAVPGMLYSIDTSTQGDVAYIAGNLPVVITVPHGGTLTPADIPDRTDSCSSISTGNDLGTIELACDMVEEFMRLTCGKYPHVVINNISRTKIDQNRAWGVDCNPTTGRGGQAWTDFHENLAASVAIERVLDEFGRGLHIDLHGKPNSGAPDYSLYWESVMIGYNLTSTVLGYSDDIINTSLNGYPEKSSLRFLSGYVADDIDFAGLLRGATRGRESFGTLLQHGLDRINGRFDKDYTVVPSHEVPAPAYLYLSGEYNIQAFCGVKDATAGLDNEYGYTSSRFMSGFQLEVSREIRETEEIRKAFAREVAAAAVKYLARHYHVRI